MKILLVTEKYSTNLEYRDGGSRLVETLCKSFENLQIMQFGTEKETQDPWVFKYPFDYENRFQRRIANADFISQEVMKIADNFTHIIFIHISMKFKIQNLKQEVWVFPMFLSPSYIASGENVSQEYIKMEQNALLNVDHVITPSKLEKSQLILDYGVLEEKIHVIPRGIDSSIIAPKIKSYQDVVKICYVGSIKLQKNILGLVRLFRKILNSMDARLKIIGPIQDKEYYQEIQKETISLGISGYIEFVGYVAPEDLALEIQDCHIHISLSNFETFGRTIFETLALGLPNIAKISCNAAYEFLSDKPYIKFIESDSEAIEAITKISYNLPKLSLLAMEIGKLYDDKILSKRIYATILNRKIIAISDFDGTLFHKGSEQKTLLCMQEFNEFPLKVICSARPYQYLLEQIKLYNLKVDWIISYSGALIADTNGNILWINPLTTDDIHILKPMKDYYRLIKENEHVLQVELPKKHLLDLIEVNTEIYGDTAFILNKMSSKLHAVQKLLNYINWDGKVLAFGDGLYDQNLLNYFDGRYITDLNVSLK